MDTITINLIGTGFETSTLTSVYWYEVNKQCYIALDANGKLIDKSEEHPAGCRAFFSFDGFGIVRKDLAK